MLSSDSFDPSKFQLLSPFGLSGMAGFLLSLLILYVAGRYEEKLNKKRFERKDREPRMKMNVEQARSAE
jgi:hypothetical protein